MRKLALIIRHAEPETLAENYTSTLVERGFELRPLNVFEGAPELEEFEPPGLDEVDLIIALGGPQSANDPYPALRSERRFFADAMASGVPVFGVCLGAQLMARALGGEVGPTGGYEFGLRKMWVTEEGSRDPVFSKLRVPLVPTLHGECFTVPPGAVELAFGYMLCRDGSFRRQSLAFRFGVFVRVPVRAAADAGGAAGMEPGAGGRLRQDGPSLRSCVRGRGKPPGVRGLLPDIRGPVEGDAGGLL